MNTRAQIKRATLQAHHAVEALDAEVAQVLIDLYRDQAADIAARIRRHAGPDDNLALQELRALLDQVEGILRHLASERDGLLTDALAQVADYGARPALGAVLETGAIVSTAASMKVAQDALFFVQTFMAEDGLQLSDRIWRIDRGARDRIANALESAIIQGHGAGQAAREFLARGEAVPAEVANKINAANASALSRTANELMTGAGSPLDNAMRLMRTEINRAHGEAYMRSVAGHPDFAGFRFLLSPSHPAPDICDLLSAQNIHGLGEGVYPNRESLPWPAHPNTLSFIESVFKDEITAADRAGKETPVQALAKLTPEQRLGVLGKGKSELYDAGKLTQGMIRAPLAVVRERIGPMHIRDILSSKYFNGQIDVSGRSSAFTTGTVEITRDNAALLLGAPDGAKVHVKQTKQTIELDATHPLYSGAQTAFITADGVLHWDLLLLRDDAPDGIGTRIAATMVEAAQAAGLREIQMRAWGPPNYNGHYTWPRLGWDGGFSGEEIKRLARAGFGGATTVRQLMQTEPGREWWKANGWEMELKFDLDVEGGSVRVLNRYLAMKGVKV